MIDEMNIVELLRAERDQIEITDSSDGLNAIRRTVRRRRAIRGSAGTAAAVVVVGGAALAIGRSGPPETVVTETPSTVEVPDTSVLVTSPVAPPTTVEPIRPTTTIAPTPTGPIIAEAVTATRLDSNLDQIDEQLAAVLDEDLRPNYALPWNGGFLIGQSSGGPSSFGPAYLSADGRSWARLELDDPITSVHASTGDRIAVAGFDWTAHESSIVIRSTTDLDAWTEVAIPVDVPDDLPPVFQHRPWAEQIAINDDGWVVLIRSSLELDFMQVAAERIGLVSTDFSGAGVQFGETEYIVELEPWDPDADPIEVRLTKDELEAEYGAELVTTIGLVPPPEVWTGRWDGDEPPVEHDLATSLGLGQQRSVVALDDALAVVVQETSLLDDGSQAAATEFFVGSPIDGTWTALEPPIDDEVLGAFALGDDLGVLARSGDGRPLIFRAEIETQTWTPIAVPGLPEQVRAFQSFGTSAFFLDAAEPIDLSPTTTRTFEQNGLRYESTFDSPFSSYEVVDLQSGETVVEESIDIREVIGSFDMAFEYFEGGLSSDATITDPATGEVVMQIPLDVLIETDPTPPVAPPERWVVATVDGEKWFVEPMPSDGSNAHLPAVTRSADLVLVSTDQNQRYVADL